ncbi:hypothetical protein GVX82_03910 [Patescibacteria group bacterium]|nr:hypothetical protein [Patescibacteria group bacterium]
MESVSASLLGLPSVHAQDFSYLNALSFETASVIGILIILTSAVALLLFLWGLALFIFQAGSDDARARGRLLMFWGVIALFVLVSIWAIVALVRSFFGIDPNPAPFGAPALDTPGEFAAPVTGGGGDDTLPGLGGPGGDELDDTPGLPPPLTGGSGDDEDDDDPGPGGAGDDDLGGPTGPTAPPGAPAPPSLPSGP